MSDFIDEEMNIADEQDTSTALSSETFLHPVEELSLPPVIALDIKSTVGQAIDLMQSKKIGSLVIVDGQRLMGIFTERDVLMRVIGKIEDWRNAPIHEVMTGSPQTLQKQDEIAYVLNNMHVGGYRHVPIVDENETPISMVSIKDVVSWILDHFPQEVTNLTGEPFRGEKSREGA
jgi:CBS domain-containing protein